MTLTIVLFCVGFIGLLLFAAYKATKSILPEITGSRAEGQEELLVPPRNQQQGVEMIFQDVLRAQKCMSTMALSAWCIFNRSQETDYDSWCEQIKSFGDENERILREELSDIGKMSPSGI